MTFCRSDILLVGRGTSGSMEHSYRDSELVLRVN